MFHPPPSAASQKPRSAGKILRMHPTANHIGLGLVRLEYAERVWWHGAAPSDALGTLTAKVGNVEWRVWVGKGEAYAAALDAQKLEQADA